MPRPVHRAIGGRAARREATAAATARVHEVLPAASAGGGLVGGWVLPPVLPADAEPLVAPATTEADPPTPPPWATWTTREPQRASALEDRAPRADPERSWTPRADPPAAAPPAAAPPAEAPKAAALRTAAPTAAAPMAGVPTAEAPMSAAPPLQSPAGEARADPGALPGVLDALRGGRLDPARRGAVALVLVALVGCVVAAVLVLRSRPQELPVPLVEHSGTPIAGAAAEISQPAAAPAPAGATPAPAPAVGTGAAEVVVAVAGKVRRPGLVRLPAGSRVDDAVRAAGGVAPGADPGLLNLARRLTDGEQVLVGVEPPPGAAPGADAAGGAAEAAENPAAAAGPVNLNAATPAQLDALPGIGPVLAGRIVAWRAEHGPFRSVDQLREVPGIGEAKFAVLRPEVGV